MRVRSGEEEKSHLYAYKSVRIQDKKKPHVHSLRACAPKTNTARIQERAHTRQEEEATRTLARACAQGDTYKTTGRNRCCTEAILDNEHPQAAATVAQQHGYRDPKLLNAHNVECTLEPMVVQTT